MHISKLLIIFAILGCQNDVTSKTLNKPGDTEKIASKVPESPQPRNILKEGYQDKSGVSLPSTAAPAIIPHTQESIPEEQTVSPATQEEVIAEKPDDTKVPLNLIDGNFKGQKGVFLEIDIIPPKILHLIGVYDIQVRILNLKIDCKYDGVTTSDCNKLISHFVRIRTNPLKTDEQILSIVFQISEPNHLTPDFIGFRPSILFDEQSFKVDLSGQRYRFHIVKEGPKSEILSPSTSPLRLTSLLIDNISSDQEMPPVAHDELLKQLPQDFQYKKEYFTMQGKYFEMKDTTWHYQELEFDIFDNKERKGSPVFKIKDGRVKDCLLRNSENICDIDFEFFKIHGSSMHEKNDGYYFRFKDYIEKDELVRIPGGKKDYFLDARVCKKHLTCSFVYYPQSSYHNDLLRLALAKKKESKQDLNALIYKLKPCIEKKDVKCVEQFFLKAEEVHTVEDEACMDTSVTLPENTFDKDDFEELAACLSYESLMFHQFALKGKNKICVIASAEVKKEGVGPRMLTITDIASLKASYQNNRDGNIFRLPPMSASAIKKIKLQLEE